MQLCLKETSTKVFSFEILEIFENTIFKEHLQTTAFETLPYAKQI